MPAPMGHEFFARCPESGERKKKQDLRDGGHVSRPREKRKNIWRSLAGIRKPWKIYPCGRTEGSVKMVNKKKIYDKRKFIR